MQHHGGRFDVGGYEIQASDANDLPQTESALRPRDLRVEELGSNGVALSGASEGAGDAREQDARAVRVVLVHGALKHRGPRRAVIERSRFARIRDSRKTTDARTSALVAGRDDDPAACRYPAGLRHRLLHSALRETQRWPARSRARGVSPWTRPRRRSWPGKAHRAAPVQSPRTRTSDATQAGMFPESRAAPDLGWRPTCRGRARRGPRIRTPWRSAPRAWPPSTPRPWHSPRWASRPRKRRRRSWRRAAD